MKKMCCFSPATNIQTPCAQYLNSGPGGIAGAFVHNKHVGARKTYFAGWWGVKLSERFRMEHVAEFMPGKANEFLLLSSLLPWVRCNTTIKILPRGLLGIRGMQLSNPGVLQTVSLLGSLQVFAQTSMTDLRAKSLLLTGGRNWWQRAQLRRMTKGRLLNLIFLSVCHCRLPRNAAEACVERARQAQVCIGEGQGGWIDVFFFR